MPGVDGEGTPGADQSAQSAPSAETTAPAQDTQPAAEGSSDKSAEAGAEPVNEGPKPAETKTTAEIADERRAAAGKWIKAAFGKAKSVLSKGTAFLNKLVFAPESLAKDAGAAVAGAAEKGYKYASDKTKEGATACVNKAKEAGERMNKAKESAYAKGREALIRLKEKNIDFAIDDQKDMLEQIDKRRAEIVARIAELEDKKASYRPAPAQAAAA